MSADLSRRGFLRGGAALAAGAAAQPPGAEVRHPLAPLRAVGDAPHDHARFRKILVSPTVNAPDPFPGYGDYCGWPTITRLQNGDLFVTFSAGYFHGSWPTPIDMPASQRTRWQTMSGGRYAWIFDWDAPTGGHIMWIRSRDQGRTWTRPRAFPVVPGAYYLANLIQLRDGTLLGGARISTHHGYWPDMPATPLEYGQIAASRMPEQLVFYSSNDQGESWQERSRISGPFPMMDAPYGLVETRDGSVLALAAGSPLPAGRAWNRQEDRWLSLLFRSGDQGRSWSVQSVLGSNDYDTTEGTIAVLPDGTIATPTRPSSAWFESDDGGRTWWVPYYLFPGKGSEQGPILYKRGSLLVGQDGLLVLVFCARGSQSGSGQVIYSRDNAKVWMAASATEGFRFDPLAYYPHACLLEDGSFLAVGSNEDVGATVSFPARDKPPWGAEVTAMRFRIKSPQEGDGIELLPIGS